MRDPLIGEAPLQSTFLEISGTTVQKRALGSGMKISELVLKQAQALSQPWKQESVGSIVLR